MWGAFNQQSSVKCPQKHEIDFRTEEQFQGDKTKEFLDKINALSEEYERQLIPKLNYTPEGVLPVIFVDIKKKEKPKKEVKTEENK